MNHPTEQATGTAIGGLLGFIKSLSVVTMVTWEAALDTAILASIGAVAGFLVTGLIKILKRKITGK